ncbi:DUF4843 domain-containing protein [Bacteroides caecimuris]|jgi:hypothetical protein|uniref:DUF4843 domain-containing protein n=1 Tax=Bacteroides caecimuris TaxID=1796613 RepID=A0A1C7H5L0_9BACE|nr:DUF4843 domain-containing protein [Bacteroides caecimuris]ANU59256.1 DUF4843 domain-containing protein [Bacteroides caecimuris]OXE68143.1 DUF4843 domain-containing protein [Bacteroides caecimuris]QQR15832.1 DUF4843 domain-containing protein [Bacteroides caecimuris]TGY41259.1 DUF4843 domain-containing protein [Bacteroides caecimuris]UQA28769.1 DUF4843 domain-containing protein [Bacteroides caecimuris]
MKRIIYFILAILVCGIYAGCSENEIDLYDQTPRINFYGSLHIRTLVDTDYVKKDDPYAIDSFTVKIQGDLLKENRDFCVKVSPNSDYQKSVDVLLESKYTYTELDTVCQVFYYKIKRPAVEAGRKVYGCFLEFDLNNPLHQFDKGLVEQHQISLNVRWELKTDEWGCWSGYKYGSYSDEKYMFIMDVCGCVYEELEEEDYDKVKQAYKEYREAGNPPILGEDGDEIVYE